MSASRASRCFSILATIGLIAYPVLVWLALSSQSPRFVALLLVAITAPAAYLRLRHSKREHLRGLASIPLVTVLAFASAALLDSANCMLLVPVAINTVLLIAFASTLRRAAMPMIERFARLQEPDLNPAQQAWCRLWTRIWCLFFVLNGLTAATLAMWAPLSWWALYNGLLAYGLMGTLFTTEWLLRRRRFPKGHAEKA